MEYVFGTERVFGQRVDVLKVVSDKPVTMTGSWNLERKYTDSVIVDSFNIKKEIRRKESTGVFYVWYQIENHYRYIDKFSPKEEKINTRIDDTENAACDLSEDVMSALDDLENAVCELSEALE